MSEDKRQSLKSVSTPAHTNAILGFTPENNIYVQFGERYIEMFGAACLSFINGVKEWDAAGYMVVDTNYGDEYYEINEFLKLLFTDAEIQSMNLLNPLETVESFTIFNDKQPENSSYTPMSIADELTITVDKQNKRMQVLDLHNLHYRMRLLWTGKWEIFTSTFPQGERKYQVYHSICPTNDETTK